MLSLPPALAGLAEYRQFTCYRLAPGKEPGKQTKFPCNHLGEIIDAHDPQYWMSADLACQWAAHGGYGVAFVFTEQDPFWFLDIDGALQDDGQWSPLATMFCQALPGCAVEISASGRGLHIFGTGDLGAHSKKNVSLNLELYSEKRFVALTGTNAIGDVRTPIQPQITEWLTTHYFKPKDRINDPDWTDSAAEEWRGPTDDEDLIRRACASRSAAAVFGGRASFNDLWTANAEVLAKVWPSKNGHTDFDHSSADMALASHLMFWTGRDCARVERLMQRSALVREKWETRVSYLYDTITEAKSLNRDVCKDKETEPVAMLATANEPAAVVSSVTRTLESRVVQGSTYLGPEQQQDLFKGCMLVISAEKAYVPSLGLLKRSQFNMLFGGYTFILDRENSKTSVDPWEAFTNSRAVRFPQVNGHCFRPDLGSGQVINVNSEQLVNLYMPIDIPMREGDATPFLTHLAKLLPNERDRKIYLSYLAAMVQHKGVKFRWAPVLQGVEGNGKTFFSVCAEFAVGRRYTHWPKAKKLGAQFNSWMYGRMLYCVEDFGPSRQRDEIIEDLKPMITGESLEIEGKGVDQESRTICGNFLFNTNHKGAVRKTANDRRFAVFYTPQQEVGDLVRDGITSEYLNELFHWARGTGPWAQYGVDYGFSVIARYLATYPIEPEFNPATNCQRAPTTSSASQAVADSLGTIESEFGEAIEEDRQGFRGGWVSGYYLKLLIEANKRTMTRESRANMLKQLGYIEHPALIAGRTARPVLPDASRSLLYVHRGNQELLALNSPDAVATAYEIAQRG